MQPETFRLFIAIRVPDAVKDQLTRVQSELRPSIPEAACRWTHREQFHLTLRFLGKVETTRVRTLVEAVQNAARSFVSIHLSAEGVGFFPHARRPRVIWAGMQDPEQQLGLLQSAIQESTGAFTCEPAEGHFSAHVTLGRIKVLRPAEAEQLSGIARAFSGKSFGHWTANAVEIFRSDLTSTGAKHNSIAVIPLSD